MTALARRIVVPGHGAVELDLAWPADRVALELEGADHRDRTTVHEQDTRRQKALLLAGWAILRTTYRRWLLDAAGLEAEVHAALGRHRRHLPLPGSDR